MARMDAQAARRLDQAAKQSIALFLATSDVRFVTQAVRRKVL
jgi:hypothetical protein